MAVPREDMLAMARELPIPVPWDRNVFVANLAAQRGRPIILIPTDTAALAGSPCGLWLIREHDDLIFHDIGTSEYHVDQIVCHEIGHMILGHGRSRATAADLDGRHGKDLTARILPAIDPETVLAVLGRTDYVSDQERDAETFAHILMIAAAEASARRSVMRGVFLRRR